MSRIRKIFAFSLAAIVAIAGLFAAVVLVRWKRTFDAPYPEIRASIDPAVIEQGRYLVHGPGHCVGCHGDPTAKDESGLMIRTDAPLTGGSTFNLPLGTFYVPNLTPDRETGIGRRSDAELARILRYAVHPDGRAVLPFMETRDMSDQDITAIISYLRTLRPIRHEVPEHEVNFLGKVIMAFVLKPQGPAMQPPKVSPPVEASVERGRYLAHSVAACVSCHTERSMVDGSYTNTAFAGGMTFPVESDPTRVLVSPNLTPDSRTGRITEWPEEQFVGRFKVGMGIPETHMPWAYFKSMDERDVRAIYRYLRSLEPVENATGPSLQPKENADS